jgi:hypothetical protein
MRRTGKYRPAGRARARSVAAKQTQAVQRPRFDSESFPARGEAEMQNGIGLERLVECFEVSHDPGIIDGKHGEFEGDAEARQSRPVFAKRNDEQRCGVVMDPRKAPEAGDENAQRRRFHALKVQARICIIAELPIRTS